MLQRIVSCLRSKEEYEPFGTREVRASCSGDSALSQCPPRPLPLASPAQVLEACLAIVTEDPAQDVALRALKLLNNGLVANPAAQTEFVESLAGHAALLGLVVRQPDAEAHVLLAHGPPDTLLPCRLPMSPTPCSLVCWPYSCA